MRTLLEDFYDADDREDWDAAMAIGGRALEEFPRESTGWAMRARIYNKIGDAGAAGQPGQGAGTERCLSARRMDRGDASP